jgi:hypothetical protein
MALKIQLRRDIAANWTANNPLLLNGEIGIETDTLKFKVGNGTQRWNSLANYALKPGQANGVATLGPDGKIPLSQIPDQISLDSEALLAIQNALSSITTTNIQEGNNLYFTNARVLNAGSTMFDTIGSSALALDAAKSDASGKISQATAASLVDATNKANQAVITARLNAENFTTTAIDLLTTSDIEEGTRLYFTPLRVNNIVGPLISETRSYADSQLVAAKAYTDAAVSGFTPPPATFTGTTSDVPEGSNLYFTNSRAITATQAARTSVLVSALGAVDDLRTEVNTSLTNYATILELTNYIPVSDRNSSGGIAGLDSNSKILESVIPQTIARSSEIVSAIEGVIASAPTAFDTLKEISDYIAQDQTAASSLTSLIGLKAPIASPTFTGTVTIPAGASIAGFAPIASPTFTGTVTIPAGALISGYATTLNLTSGLSSTLTAANDYTDLAIDGVNNSLGDYQPEAERNQNNGYAGLDSSGKILISAVPTISNLMLEKNSININGSEVALGETVITGYTNGISGSNVNKITYGTNITPPSSGNSAGDIYIQY